MNEQRIRLRRQRDLGQIFEATVTLYSQNALPLLSIAAVVVPIGIASAAFQTGIDNFAVELGVLSALNLLQAVVSLVVAAALIAALNDIDAGRPAAFDAAYEIAFARFWTVLLAALRAAFHVLLFAITIIGIPWAVQRAIRWLFVVQAVILDGTSARAALSYSADAVIGSWWRTAGINLLIGIITGVPAGIVSALFVLAPPLVSGTVNAVVTAALLPFSITAMTLLYMDLKARKETAAVGGTTA
jgi:hypothetical protein